jgi:acetyl esterase
METQEPKAACGFAATRRSGKDGVMAQTSAIYDPARSYDVEVRDVEYRRINGGPLLVRLFEPKGTGPFPAILNVHGGAWNNGDRTANPQFSEGLAASGAVVAAIDFRHGADPYPSSLVDINYAIRWLKAHAGDFKADAATVGGMGVSSGGHLIVLSAMRPDDPRYAADPLPEAPEIDATLAYVITCWGVLDPYARYLLAKEKGQAELIGNHDRYWLTTDAMQEGNPVMTLKRGEHVQLPPCLLIQPSKDQWMSPEGAEDFGAAYRAAGGQCDVALYPGMPHGIAGWDEASIQAAVSRMKEFIARNVTTTAASR